MSPTRRRFTTEYKIEAAHRVIDSEPLSGAERAELLALRKQVHEQEKDLEFLGKAAAYFAKNQPNKSGLR